MLGCPNLPQGPVGDDDGATGSAQRLSGDADVGCLFFSERGQGAWVEPLQNAGDAAPAQVRVAEVTEGAEARFMESVESRHSSHSINAALVGRGRTWRGWGCAAAWETVGRCSRAGIFWILQ